MDRDRGMLFVFLVLVVCLRLKRVCLLFSGQISSCKKSKITF